VTGTDATSLVVAPLLVVAVGIIATIGPAWAASRAEVLSVLREP
jgi:ABC-type lipoprotein release transport system permease subunit